MNKVETERLRLTLYTDREKTDFIGLLTDPAVMKYVDRGVMTNSQAEALWLKLPTDLYPKSIATIWAVKAKDDGRYLGNASIRPRPEHQNEWEIGYYLRRDEWGKGFATELANRLIRYGFDTLNLHEIFATVDVDNMASKHVLDKAGLRLFRSERDEQGPFHVYRIARPPASTSA